MVKVDAVCDTVVPAVFDLPLSECGARCFVCLARAIDTIMRD